MGGKSSLKDNFNIIFQQHYYNLKVTISEEPLNSHISLPPYGPGLLKAICAHAFY